MDNNMMKMDPIRIEHGDNIHFYKIAPRGFWLWKCTATNYEDSKCLELVFSICISNSCMDSAPFLVRNDTGSFRMYLHTLQEVKEVMEYQLNMQLINEPFEVYESMILALKLNDEL